MSDAQLSLAAIDTNTLGWMVKRRGVENDKEMCRRAKILANIFDRKEAPIIVSTVVVAEFLRPVPEAEHDATLSALHSLFRVHPVDVKASVIAARLWRAFVAELELAKQLIDDKQRLKSDLLIVASSIAGGARVFYSHDCRARKLAELGGIRARDLPTHREQLFDEDD